MINLLKNAVKEQPLGAIAIVVSLVTFVYDVAKDDFFNGADLRVSCGTPLDSAFEHEDGFLFYESRCLIANQSQNSISLASLTPVMLHGSYPYPLVGRRSMNPTISTPYDSNLGTLFTKMASQFPVFLSGGEAFATDVVVFTSVGEMRHIRSDDAQCSKNLAFDRLSAVQLCIEEDQTVEVLEDQEGDGVAKQPVDLSAYANTAKEQIYRGYSYGMAEYDGFGLEISLGDGTRYIVEADLTDVLGYRCTEDIRQLNCKNYSAKQPRVINIGLEPDYGRYNWQSVLFILAVFSVVWLTFRLSFEGVRYVSNEMKKSQTPVVGNDADVTNNTKK